MKVLIIGAGAIGLWLGAYFILAENQVTFVGRPNILQAVKQNGLTVTNVKRQCWTVNRFDAAVSIQDAVRQKHEDITQGFDIVLFCVKSYSLDDAVKQAFLVRDEIAGAGTKHPTMPIMVCFQNGVGNEETIARSFGSTSVVSATTTSPIMMASSGIMTEAKANGSICLAPVVFGDINQKIERYYGSPQKAMSHNCASIVDTFRSVGMSVREYPDHLGLKWSKMLLNMLGNASGAILDMPAAKLYQDARIFALEMRMVRETQLVMKRLGIKPLNLPHFPAALLALAAEYVPEVLLRPILTRRLASGRGDKRPSFSFDIARRTGHSEVHWLNGAVTRYGEQLGIATPVNHRLTMLMDDLVSGRQAPADWRGQVGKLVDGLI